MRTLFVEYKDGTLSMYEKIYEVRVDVWPENKFLMWSSPSMNLFSSFKIIRRYWEEDLP